MTDHPLETELDFLAFSIDKMREMQRKDPQKAVHFEREMQEYFHLSPEMCSSFIYDEIVRLHKTKAGTLKKRDPKILARIHKMQNGDYFRVDTRLAVFRKHSRLGHPKDGWFTYTFTGEFIERTMDYHEAWTLATNGQLTFGRGI